VPWVVRDAVHDLNKAVGRRWRGLDPLLPQPGDLPAGCAAPLVVTGSNGRPAGLGVCLHQHVPADTLSQTWGAATRFVLVPRLRDTDTLAAADDLLTQWRDHLAGLPEAHADDTAAMITWPSRDVTGIRALVRHGLAPVTVLAARPADRPVPADRSVPADRPVAGAATRLTVRKAGLADLDTVTEMEMGVIRWDAQFGGPVPRPATQALVREQARTSLARSSWAWLAEAERDGRPVGLLTVLPPEEASWVAAMVRTAEGTGGPAYLSSMFVHPAERGRGVGTALVRHAHHDLDASGVPVTLLDYAQVNPVSGPFWSRMGYRPLWTRWEARPASALR
jgi:GNAT superfamily N-acetyltransferase